MRYGLFGRTGLRVSELFLGAMRFGSVDQARPIIDRYAEAGGNVIDTADAYGASEDLVGEGPLKSKLIGCDVAGPQFRFGA
ncbi:aldo/keto reductase family protein [Kribbella sp. VKM Ac-2527]|uniref:Aldo/keto reductase family protein n=1 Tax=Kribbella caucasensis TaxID=2512215 RepID=A0A4R6KQD2_9ACTN|nr:aldo/keto reductase [Kribbella sp. VKM Ac-2527]TDO54915.1 aldo/keto reductase family protein [Kribbella sp. VKM Ac-2527]